MPNWIDLGTTALPAGTQTLEDAFAAFDTCTFATDGTGDITVGSAHGLSAGNKVQFSSTGALPSEIAEYVTYYVLASGLTTTKLRIAATVGGTLITFAGAGTGTHSLWKLDHSFYDYPDADTGYISGEFLLFPSDQFSAGPLWGTWDFADAIIGEPYNFEWFMENVSYPVDYSIASGSLPPGLTLVTPRVDTKSQGRVHGTPTLDSVTYPHTYSFILLATNDDGSVQQGFSITVDVLAVGGFVL